LVQEIHLQPTANRYKDDNGSSLNVLTLSRGEQEKQMSLASKIVADAKAFRNEIVKIAAAVPGVVTKITAEAPEVTAIAELAFPNAAAIEQHALAVADAVQAATTAAGTAAASNGLNAVQDKGVISAVEALEALIKKL
jgi:hypothetical protein